MKKNQRNPWYSPGTLFIVKEKYGGLRSVARMCQGAAISSMIASPLSGRRRLQVRRGEELACAQQINNDGRDRKDDPDQAFQQQPDAQRGGQRRRPCSRMPLVSIKHSQKRPHRQRDRERKHHVRQQNARKQPQPDASRHTKAGVKPCPSSKCPGSKCRRKPAKRRPPIAQRNARSPVMHAENLVSRRRSSSR